MTFEEFFEKKKINISALTSDDRVLFDELFHHFTLMGEKSFDHSKKFLFNALRHRFPLIVPISEQRVNLLNNSLKENSNLDTSTISSKPIGFKPKFRLGNTSNNE